MRHARVPRKRIALESQREALRHKLVSWPDHLPLTDDRIVSAGRTSGLHQAEVDAMFAHADMMRRARDHG